MNVFINIFFLKDANYNALSQSPESLLGSLLCLQFYNFIFFLKQQ